MAAFRLKNDFTVFFDSNSSWEIFLYPKSTLFSVRIRIFVSGSV